MTQNVMPFLILNYGGEMVFILEQRLQAQAVRGEKATKVLLDVSQTLFERGFIDELVKPHAVWSQRMTRDVFDRLAQSSIMKLSSASMEKLFDLMTMGCKYHAITCAAPREIADVTLRVLDTIAQCLAGTQATEEILRTRDQILQVAHRLTTGQCADVRHAMLNFYQDKRIKVTLFLQEQLQGAHGIFKLPRGGPLPASPPSVPVGTVTYFDNGVPVGRPQPFAHPDAALSLAPLELPRMGRALYGVERVKGSASGAGADVPSLADGGLVPPTKTPAHSPGGGHHPGGPLAASPEARSPPAPTGPVAQPLGKHASYGHEEANSAARSLSHFLVQRAARPGADNFRINLFPEDGADDATAAAGGGGGYVPVTYAMSHQDRLRANSEVLAVADGWGEAPAPAGGGGDDLLDLMDGT